LLKGKASSNEEMIGCCRAWPETPVLASLESAYFCQRNHSVE